MISTTKVGVSKPTSASLSSHSGTASWEQCGLVETSAPDTQDRRTQPRPNSADHTPHQARQQLNWKSHPNQQHHTRSRITCRPMSLHLFLFGRPKEKAELKLWQDDSRSLMTKKVAAHKSSLKKQTKNGEYSLHSEKARGRRTASAVRLP